MKAIVFDFDETLGHFGELGEFVENLEHWFVCHRSDDGKQWCFLCVPRG